MAISARLDESKNNEAYNLQCAIQNTLRAGKSYAGSDFCDLILFDRLQETEVLFVNIFTSGS